MARNSLGREVPDVWHGKRYEPYQDPWSAMPTTDRATRPLVRRNPGRQQGAAVAARGDRAVGPARAA